MLKERKMMKKYSILMTLLSLHTLCPLGDGEGGWQVYKGGWHPPSNRLLAFMNKNISKTLWPWRNNWEKFTGGEKRTFQNGRWQMGFQWNPGTPAEPSNRLLPNEKRLGSYRLYRRRERTHAVTLMVFQDERWKLLQQARGIEANVQTPC